MQRPIALPRSAGYAPPTKSDDSPRVPHARLALEPYQDHEEVVFWFEHDLLDQLLLIRHLWWLVDGTGSAHAVQPS